MFMDDIDKEIQKLKNTQQELENRVKITKDLNNSNFTPHLINIVIHLQELNRKLDSLDKNSLMITMENFNRSLNVSLKTIGEDIKEYSHEIKKTDLSSIVSKIDSIHLILNELELNFNRSIEKLISGRQFKIFIEDSETKNKLMVITQNELKSSLSILVKDAEFSVRTIHCLLKENIKNIAELVVKKETEILKIKNLGKNSLKEIKDFLKSKSLTLGMSSADL